MQGFNKYYPPTYDPSQGSVNTLNGTHALGKRANKLDQGILIVRFELPYNIWCGKCGNHLGMGVRYNAEKKKVGMYFSSPIFGFRCKCHLCDNWFEIRTDPQNTRYVVHAGAKQKNEEWDPAENGGVVLDDKPAADLDAFASLERATTSKVRALTAAQQLDALEALQSSRWSDPYAASVALRSAFRGEKKVRVESEARATYTRDKYGLGERVRMEDLRTPGGELLQEERREWESAQGERSKREDIRNGKRKREEQEREWKVVDRSKRKVVDEGRSSKSIKDRHHSGSSQRSITSSSRQLKPALSALASQILYNTAPKSDPFRLASATASSLTPIKSTRQSSGILRLPSKEKVGGV